MNVKNKREAVLGVLARNNGRITSKEAAAFGIHRMYLKMMADDGFLVRNERGVYQKADVLNDELFDLQTTYPTGIFSFETALYLHGLTERVPLAWTMTFRGKYHAASLAAKGVEVRHVKAEWYGWDAEEVFSPSGNPLRAYSVERTLCEILRPWSRSDIQTIAYAYKAYARRSDRDTHKLIEHAKIFKVENKVRSYLEVLT